MFRNERLIKRLTSLRLPRKRLEGTSNIKEIKLHRNVKNMKIEEEYYNGREHIEGPNILIDTGACECHIASIRNKGLTIHKVEPYRYVNFGGQMHTTELEAKEPIKIGRINIVVSCYIDNSMSIDPHILLGISFLNGSEDYSIKREGLYITHNGQIILCEKR